MPPLSQDKKNNLQSVVDSIQSQAIKTEGPAQGYVPNPNLKSLRTFQGDMQEHIDTKQETVTSIALAQQKKHIELNEPTYTDRSPQKSHSGLFIVIGIIFLICGGVVFGAIYFLHSVTEPATTKVALQKTPIPYLQKKDIALQSPDTQTLTSSLLQERSSFKSEVNTVLYTIFTHNAETLKTTELINLIASHAGDALKRNISEVMTGVFSYDTNEVFFVLHPDDFGIAYSGMLDWESMMGQDLSPFFPALKEHLITHASIFYDETYKNKDVRVIRNDAGNIVLLYGFLDRETLVITANERIFEAILAKYNQHKLSR